jgi:SNF family Na+-dependent transporter
MRRHLPLLVALVLLLLIYLPTLQTIPNGSDHYFMIDVGETQIVLNVWGTLHATGYPLYVLLSAPLVTLLRAVGVDAAAAPALTSLLWGLLALAGVYVLGVRILGGNTDAINGVPTEQSGVGTAFMLSAALQTRVRAAAGTYAHNLDSSHHRRNLHLRDAAAGDFAERRIF